MRIPEIESHLRELIPVIYPSFSSDWISISSAAVSSDTMTLTASNSYVVSDNVIISGFTYKNTISSVTLSLSVNTAIVQMAAVHEFTESFSETLIISGATETEWNDTFEILQVLDRYRVEIRTSTAITGEPTGTPVVEEINLPRYNRLFSVTAATTATFTVAVINAPDGTLSGTGQVIALNKVNISSSVDFDHVINSYTKQDIDTVWIYIVAGATSSSKSRDTNTDFDQSFQSGEARIIRTQDNFSIFAFYPAFNKTTAVEAQDTARNELRQALISSLVGFIPSSLLASSSDEIYYIADGIEDYNTSYYVHRYDFAVNVNITQDDTYIADSYAVRKIQTSYIDEDSREDIAVDNIDFTEIV